MKTLPLVLIAQMTETRIILTAVPLIALAYWVCILQRKKPFNLQELIVLVFDAVAVITGVSMLVSAFKMADSSAENAVWLGIGGVCLAFMFAEQVRIVFKGLLRCQPDSDQRVESTKDV